MINKEFARFIPILLCLALIWGSSFSVIKVALDSIGPYWISAARICLATLMLVLLGIFIPFRLPKTLREWLVVSSMGILGTAVPFALIGWASVYVPSGTAGLMMATNPMLIMLIAMVFLPEEKATSFRFIGLIMGFLGVTFVLLGRSSTSAAHLTISTSIWPYFALLVASACYAITVIIVRRVQDIPLMTRSIGSLLIGSILALLFAYIKEPLPQHISGQAALATLYLAAFPTALATIGVFWLISKTSAGFVAQSNYLVPIMAVFIGAIVFAEQLGWLQYLGTALVLFGIAVSDQIWGNWQNKKRGPKST